MKLIAVQYSHAPVKQLAPSKGSSDKRVKSTTGSAGRNEKSVRATYCASREGLSVRSYGKKTLGFVHEAGEDWLQHNRKIQTVEYMESLKYQSANTF